jgi:hypothetical protein
MFAGLPGIGVGTLFYVLTALWMPFPECVRLVRGQSSVARWRLIAIQLFFAISIVASIAAAERVLLWIMGEKAPPSLNPARLVNEGFSALSPQTMLAAPITASVILLAAVLLVVEAARVAYRFATQESPLAPSQPGALTRTVSPPNSADAA